LKPKYKHAIYYWIHKYERNRKINDKKIVNSRKHGTGKSVNYVDYIKYVMLKYNFESKNMIFNWKNK